MTKLLALLPLLFCCALQSTRPAEQVYSNDFETAEEGEVPPDMLVLNGNFAVKKDQSGKYLELPGAPLESFGLLIGPEAGSVSAVGARIRAAAAGKRFPEFGVGLCGAGGYKLWLMPAVNELQLIKGDEVKAAVPYAWTSGTWTAMRLQLRAAGEEKWLLQGKAWQHGQPEPPRWMISIDEPEAPPGGRASIWGTPYSEKPIGFDDLLVHTERKQ